MTYIVYIPDAERGPTAYTQRTFDSLKALARWAMDAVLKDTTDAIEHTPPAPIIREVPLYDLRKQPPTRPPKETVTMTPSEYHHSLVYDEPIPKPKDTIVGSLVSKLLGSSKPQQPTPKPATPEPVWAEDTDSWFGDGGTEPDVPPREPKSEWQVPLRERDWPLLAQMMLGKVLVASFREPTNGNEYRQALTLEDLQWCLRQFVANIGEIAEEVLVETQVRWGLLPAEFAKACYVALLEQPHLGMTSDEKIIANDIWKQAFWIPAAAWSRDLIQILRFYQHGCRHASWKDVVIQEGTLRFTDPYKTTAELAAAWWRGGKTTDMIREFLLKSLVVRYFMMGGVVSTMGSTEFLDQYNTVVVACDLLPVAFLAWATRGTTYKHCKKALTDLGISSVRRAEGQRYSNLQKITDEIGMIYIYQDDLAAAPLFTDLVEAEMPATVINLATGQRTLQYSDGIVEQIEHGILENDSR